MGDKEGPQSGGTMCCPRRDRSTSHPGMCARGGLWPRIDAGQGIELEVVALVEPRTLEGFDRQTGAPGQGEGVDGELGHGVLLFSGVGFVIQDMEEAGAELQEVDVAGDGVGCRRER